MVNITENVRDTLNELDIENTLPYTLSSNHTDVHESVLDEMWLKDVFMVSTESLEQVDRDNRYFSSANFKFTDTTMGGNLACNARPQYTRYCDIRVPGVASLRNKVTVNSNGNHGMGRYYSEAIDDNAQKVYLSFGVPEFNGIFEFFARAIDYESAVVANTGRSPVAYNVASTLANVAIFIAFPIVALTVWTIKGVNKFFFGSGGFNYYYMKPTMHTYWSTVNTIVTMLATEMGILIPEFMEDGSTPEKLGNVMKFNQRDLEYIRNALPNIITKENHIDVYAIVNRAQMMANKQMLEERKLYQNGVLDRERFIGYLKTKYTKTTNGGLSELLNEVIMLQNVYGFRDKKDNQTDTKPTMKGDPTEAFKEDERGRVPMTETEKKKHSSWSVDYAKYFDSIARGGGSHVVFQVEYTGAVTETFTNTVKEMPVAGMVKSVANKGRDIRFSLGGGNIVDGLGEAMGYAKDVVAGTLDSFTFGLSNVLSTIFGSAYVDLPKMYDDSTVELPTHEFKARLVSPYNNPFSQLQNIYIPLGMLLAGSLPLQTGKSSYTSPYLCNLFMKGISYIQLGMITSLTVSRGVSNLGFSKTGRALAIDVTFSVTDFSSIMSAPVNNSPFGAFKMSLNDDNLLNRYIATLGSRDLHTVLYNTPKFKMRLSNLVGGIETILSPSFNAQRDGDIFKGIFGGLLSNMSLNQLDTNN